MKHRFGRSLPLVTSLTILSLAVYYLRFLVTGDPKDVLSYFLSDLAFLPLEILLVTVILQRILNEREKRSLLRKMNMVIGAFFSEVGTNLLGAMTGCHGESQQLRADLAVAVNWSVGDFAEARRKLKNHKHPIAPGPEDLLRLRSFLLGKRGFMLALLQNPNLLEHDTFTELLWAVFHLTEELALRPDLDRLSDKDRLHLAGDAKRAYVLLALEWMSYLEHLCTAYPYLYSLAVRMNPLNPEACPEIK